MGAAAPMSAPKAAEMPMGSMPEKKETMTGGEMKDEAQSEDMK
jgi:hypothetical protein